MQSVSQKVLTFVFTDLTDSTRFWDRHAVLMPLNLQELTNLVNKLSREHDGNLFKTVGDEFCLVFESPDHALAFSKELHALVNQHPWPPETPFRMKTAVHIGPAHPVNGDFFGPALNEVARLLSFANPNDILVSQATFGVLTDTSNLRYIGRRIAKGIADPIEIHIVDTESHQPPATRSAPQQLPIVNIIGRQQELSDIHGLISSNTAIITVTGIGGIGKTTLVSKSLEIASLQHPTVFVDCTYLESEQDILTALLSALQSDAPVQDSLQEVSRILAAQKTLVCLDCFENILSQRTLIDEILRRAPATQFLVSSRTILGLSREYEYPLKPLNVTSPEASSELFLSVASKKGRSIEPSPENLELVHEICQNLDHIPLAIVLAASRLRTVALAELAERLKTKKIATLQDRHATNPKHASLLQTIKDSLEILPRTVSPTLKKIAYFQGGFLISDAAKVLNPDPDELEEDLAILIDHSILSTRPQNKSTRFVLLDSIREVLLEDPDPDILKAHSNHYANYPIAAFEARNTAHLTPTRQSLLSELANVRLALKAAQESDNTPLQLRIQVGLLPALLETGRNQEFLDAAQSTLSIAQKLGDTQAELIALGTEGAFWFLQQLPQKGIELWERRLKLARSANDHLSALDTLLDLAEHKFGKNETDAAQNYLDQALEILHFPDCAPLRATYYAVQLNAPQTNNTPETLQSLATSAKENLPLAVSPTHRGFVIHSLAKYFQLSNLLDQATDAWINLLAEGAELGHYPQTLLAAIGLVECRLKRSEDPSIPYALIQSIKQNAGNRFTERLTNLTALVQSQSPESIEKSTKLLSLSPEALCTSITPCAPAFPQG